LKEYGKIEKIKKLEDILSESKDLNRTELISALIEGGILHEFHKDS
jgi:hypothetical protein